MEKGQFIYEITKSGEQGGTVKVKKAQKKNAKTLTIPSAVKINERTFQVTAIAENAFKNNRRLKKVTIGKNVEKLGEKAFYGDKALKRLVIKGTRLKKVGKKALSGISPRAVIDVPNKKIKQYRKYFRKKGQAATVKIK